MKNKKSYILFALLMMASRLFAYDFEAIRTFGQTLCYNINDDGIYVTVTCPCCYGQYNTLGQLIEETKEIINDLSDQNAGVYYKG